MNAAFDPIGALILVAWLGAGAFAVFKFFQKPQPTLWHWVSLIVGVVMLALGVGIGGLGLYTLRRISR